MVARSLATEARGKPDMAEASARLWSAFQASMVRAGIDPMYLSEENWKRGWGKHFEHIHEEGRPDLYYTARQTFGESGTLRVMQWNILAEGLGCDGFLMPLVMKQHGQDFEKRLAAIVETGDADGISAAAELYAMGQRNVVWEAVSGRYVEFVEMASKTMLRMKSCASKEAKVEVGKELCALFSPESAPGAKDGQFALNERTVVAAEHRLLRTLWFVSILEPDVLCMQECDNFAFISEELAKMGYACSTAGAPAYEVLSDRLARGETYVEALKGSQWAFAPKTGLAPRCSHAREFLTRDANKARLCGKEYPIDDDGTAIFWRTHRVRLVTAPEFIVLPGKKDVQHYVDGTTDELGRVNGNSGAVRVQLAFSEGGWGEPASQLLGGHSFYVVSTHLTSGVENEVRRISELRSLWPPSGLPEVWVMDANTELDFADPAGKVSECAIPSHSNALRTFLRERRSMRSVWEPHYAPSAVYGPPISVWKMRGAASNQPSKMGEEDYKLIDHIFYDGKGLFKGGGLALNLREHKSREFCHDATAPDRRESDRRDWLALLPNEVVPSDHLPIVWDFELERNPQLSLPALIAAANKLLAPVFAEAEQSNCPDEALWSLKMTLAMVKTLLHSLSTEVAKGPLAFSHSSWAKRMEDEAIYLLATESKSHNRHESRPTMPGSGCLAELFTGSDGMPPELARELARTAAAASACLLMAGLLFSSRKASLKMSDHLALGSLRCVFRAIDVGDQRLDDPTYRAAFLAGHAPEADAQQQWPSSLDGCKAPDSLSGSLSAQHSLLLRTLVAQRPTTLWLLALASQTTRALVRPKLQERPHDTESIVGLYDLLRETQSSSVTLPGGRLDHLLAEAEFLISTHEPKFEIPALLAVSCVQWATCSGGPAARVIAMVVRLIHERASTFGWRSLTEEAAMRALKQVALSPNIDTGGGLGLLLGELQMSMHALSSGDADASAKRARALGRPPPEATLTNLRSAAAVLCGKISLERLLIPSQRLHAASSEGGSAVDQLAASLRYVRKESSLSLLAQEADVKTVGYILKILHEVLKCKTGPRTLLAIFLNGGIGDFAKIFIATKQLPVENIERWRTHMRTLKLINALLKAPKQDDNLLVAFHKRFVESAVANAPELRSAALIGSKEPLAFEAKEGENLLTLNEILDKVTTETRMLLNTLSASAAGLNMIASNSPQSVRRRVASFSDLNMLT